MKQKAKKKLLAEMCYKCGGKYARIFRYMIENDFFVKYLGIDYDCFIKSYVMRAIMSNGNIWGFPIKKSIMPVFNEDKRK